RRRRSRHGPARGGSRTGPSESTGDARAFPDRCRRRPAPAPPPRRRRPGGPAPVARAGAVPPTPALTAAAVRAGSRRRPWTVARPRPRVPRGTRPARQRTALQATEDRPRSRRGLPLLLEPLHGPRPQLARGVRRTPHHPPDLLERTPLLMAQVQ